MDLNEIFGMMDAVSAYPGEVLREAAARSAVLTALAATCKNDNDKAVRVLENISHDMYSDDDLNTAAAAFAGLCIATDNNITMMTLLWSDAGVADSVIDKGISNYVMSFHVQNGYRLFRPNGTEMHVEIVR